MSSRIEQVIDEIEEFIENCEYKRLSKIGRASCRERV